MADKRTQLEKVIQTGVDSYMKEVHTCLPAVVTKVHNPQLIDCQITIKRKMNGNLVNLPLCVEVPIRYPRSKTFSITFPIEVDDHVELRFCERSIDTWLTQGGIQNPFDFRKFELADAFATPAMYPDTDLIPDFDDTNMEFKTNSGDTKIIVKASEDVEVITTGEVKAVCETLLAIVETSSIINTDTLTANVETDAEVNCDTAVINADSSLDITSPISTINGNVQINGNLTVTGIIAAPTFNATGATGSFNSVGTSGVMNTKLLNIDGADFTDHEHTDSTTGIDNTGGVA